MDTSVTEADRIVSRIVREKMKRRQISNDDLIKLLGRSHGYISERLNGRRSWAISELDQIAPLIGYSDVFALIDEAEDQYNKLVRQKLEEHKPDGSSEWTLVADTDPNKRIESETPDD